MPTRKTSTAPWKKKNPKRTHSKLTPAQKKAAQAAAKKAGRRYPNLVDNMNAAKKKSGSPARKKAAPKKRPS